MAMDLDADSETQKILSAITSFTELIYKLELQLSLWRIYPTKDYKRFVNNMDYLVE